MVGDVAHHEAIGDDADADPAATAMAPSRRPQEARAFDRRLLRQEVQRDQEEEDRHRLDRDLRQREVGGGEVDEGRRDHQPDDRDHHQRQEALAVDAGRRRGAAIISSQPDGDDRRDRASGRACPGVEAAARTHAERAKRHGGRTKIEARQRAVVRALGDAAREAATSAAIEASNIRFASGRGRAGPARSSAEQPQSSKAAAVAMRDM